MKKSIAIALILALTGCGGESVDEWSNTGGTGTNTPSQPSVPSTDGKDGWRYFSVENGEGEIFYTRGEVDSLNTYPNPKYAGLKSRAFIYAERERLLPKGSGISESIKIFTGSAVACTPTCEIPIKFNNSRQSYQMRYSTNDEVLIPASNQVGKDLFNKLTLSNSATISLPIIGINKDVDLDFNLRGYKASMMKLSIENL